MNSKQIDSILKSLNPLIGKTFNLQFGKLEIAPTYWQAVAIIFLLFLLVLTLARVRYLYIHWSVSKPSISMILWGFLLALILEGFLIIGGRTMFTEVLGWQNPPKPIKVALEAGREKLINVLGVTSEIPTSNAKVDIGGQEVIEAFQNFSSDEAKAVKSVICRP